MPSPPKKYPYNVFYEDGTFMTYEFTRADYQKIEQTMMEEKPYVSVSIGILSLKNVRAIVEQKLVEDEVEETPADSGYPLMDSEEYLWLKEQQKIQEELAKEVR